MTPKRLSRSAGAAGAPRPARLVHVGLGNFFRAHQAWYTDRARDRDEWGYTAFSWRAGAVVEALRAQDGLYTVVTRSPDRDRFELVGSISRVHSGGEHDAWLRCFAAPELAAVTVTVTEAGWLRGPADGIDLDRPEVRSDVETLRRDPTAPVGTAPGRLLAGLLARRAAGAGPIAVVPCDNLPSNGPVAMAVLRSLGREVDPSLEDWLTGQVAAVTTVVDRITPRPGPGDAALVADETGWDDRSPIVTEPFHEWVLCGEFPAGRPEWEAAGARLVDEAGPFENRKLWLLNGAHSLLAYAGSILGHSSVPEAAADPECRAWVEEWWAVASPHLDQPDAEVADYRCALAERFANTRLADRLARIAEDGSQKLPVRILPVLKAERAAGRLPIGAVRILAAWVCHLRGYGVPVRDARANEVVPLAQGPAQEAVARVLDWLGPDLAADVDLRSAALRQCEELTRRAVGD